MKIQYKKIISNVIVLLLSFGIGLLMSYNAKGYNVVKLSENISLTDSDISYIYGYDISESEYTPYNNDPQIGFQGLNADINVILISLSESVQQDTFVQIYYALVGQGLCEQNSIKGYIYEGEKEFFAFLPEEVYGEIRIDINGSFVLESIIGSTDPLICEKTLEGTDGLLACIIAVVLWASVYMLWGKKEVIYNNIRKNVSEYTKTKWFLFGTFLTSVCVWGILWTYTLITTSPLGKEWYEALLLWTLVVLTIFVTFLGRNISEKKECLFVWISVLFGAYLVVTMPLGTVSWDDEVHYKRAVQVSHIFDGQVSDAELSYTTHYIEEVNDPSKTSEIKEELLQIHEQTSRTVENSLDLYSILSYIPSAGFLFLGRVLNMPAYSLYYMGRLGMLGMYALLVYQAMKRIKSGKMLLAVIALFPTNLFLCASYSYDPWVTGFSLLGISIIISELQQPEKQMKWIDVGIMLGSFFMMGSAKAIYFPLLLLALFIKRNKFKNMKEYKLFLCSVFAVIFVLILNYIIPVLSGGSAVSDIRGGADVNGIEQIKFILQNPLEYIKILFTFLGDYFSIEMSVGYTTFFAYLGYGINLEVLWILVGIVTITDKNEYDSVLNKWHRWGMFGIAFVTMVLVATALYVKFTPVALMTINGCQPRYIMPVLFPVLLLAGSNKIINCINKNYYTLAIYGIEMYVIVSCIWETCISKYS